mmetsp:Transcript_4178/g.10644  ORF Transcript_4178/g.10644 Transcript_4178/m.10644 type:complete len:210 (-) Transcript_4178:1868-2497(-)
MMTVRACTQSCCHCDLLLCLLLFLFLPHSILLDQINQRINSLRIRNALPDDLLSIIQVHLARQRAHVSKVGVCHLSRPVHNASHDGHGNAGQVTRCLRDLRRRILQVEERTSARRAGDEFRLGVTHATSLQQGEASVAEEIHREVGLADLFDQYAVPVSVSEQRTDLGPELEGELVGFGRGGFVVVDGRDGDVVGLEVFEDATGGVQLG